VEKVDKDRMWLSEDRWCIIGNASQG